MPQNETARLIDEGLAAHQAGDIAKARANYEAVLRKEPDHPEALHLLGLALEQQGERATALELIGRAVQLDPGEPAFRINLAALLERQNDFTAAAQHLRVAADAAPSDAAIRMRLARALYQAGAYNDAFQAAMSANAVSPPNVSALKIAAAAAHQARNWRALVETAEAWRRADPSDLEALRFLAGALFETGEPKKAKEAFKAIAESPTVSAEDLTAYGRYCLSAFDYQAARTALEKALAAAPGSAMTVFALSRLHFFEGDLKEAEKMCRRAIDADPDLAPAYPHLARLTDGNVDDRALASMQRLANSDNVAAEHKSSLCFALGDILHRQARYDEAMAMFAAGNQTTENLFRAESCTYNAANMESVRRRELELLHGNSKAASAKMTVTPIFIVGMPRSGTTLIESVLAAHPEVFGAGELTSMPSIHADVLHHMVRSGINSLDAIPAEQLKEWRRQYISSWPETGSASLIVDKQPANFRSVGLLRILFPEAPIIHIRRDPVETGFSIYRHDFNKAWPFATGLEKIAHYYGEYARIMAHWDAYCDAPPSLFQYENFVDDFENEAKRLIAACGLEWRNECLEFHNQKRPVATFSAAQVRQPVKRKSTNVREQYGERLKPLIDGLEGAGIDLETGAYRGDSPAS